MYKKLSEIFVFGSMAAVSIVLWFNADALPKSKKYIQVDSDLWPKLVFFGLAICCGIYVIQKLREFRIDRTAGNAAARHVNRGYVQRLALIAALTVAYFIGLQYTGFPLATLLFLWAASSLLPYKNTIAKIVFAPVFTLFMGLFLSRALSLPLPRGVGIFYEFSEALF